ncbi:DEAD/DEAH box helicase family protein [Ureaplasma zalophigenitalium]|uniref:type I site-specific deoxyribonuclease n=1 Tax=Ureaplasma zalophigenitalium TaxID=907723 RepID=A0ABT3BPD8_9BACT|nr:DEAD/DEAH box helicase family protein [Ureaplasma zalophigenitalium]MCV3754048.1 DEAD/DEAH box helicase family protein [Ureaplasma zalophigenitalium]
MAQKFFETEKEFQDEIVTQLTRFGNWKVLGSNSNDTIPCQMNNVNEQQIYNNWRNILNQMNKDKLGEYPITDEEFFQLKNKVDQYTKTISKANESLREGLIIINRTEERSQDYQKDVYLRFFPHGKVNPADNIYQIATEVSIERKNKKRLDVVLLINGIPLFHIELKKSASLFNKAAEQIRTYFSNGIYEGLFGFIQVLVAMTPDKMAYWPNASKLSKLEKNMQNRMVWTDFDNIAIHDWSTICNQFLSIPAAHKLVQDYSIANNEDDELLLLRSYQFHGVEAIMQKFDKSSPEDIWLNGDSSQAIKGGYIWHTTGSGKTLTSFKVARLLLDYNYASKVVFVVDRITLNNQTESEFNRFENRSSDGDSCVCVPRTSDELANKLIQADINKQIIITTINKLGEMVKDKEEQVRFAKLSKEKFVFIFDEAHRSVAGDRYAAIINFFKNSVVIGFTGTPIFQKDANNFLTTKDLFGGEKPIHTYTIANGIADKKVLKFSIDYICLDEYLTFWMWYTKNNINPNNHEIIHYFKTNKAQIIRELNTTNNPDEQTQWQTLKNMINDKQLNKTNYYELEKLIKDSKGFNNTFYKNSVAQFIMNDWYTRSSRRNFSGLFATSNINDAIDYFRIFQEIIENDSTGKFKNFKITAIFDDSISSDVYYLDEFTKFQAIAEIIDTYNKNFKTNWKFDQYKREFKDDVTSRLGHKGQYNKLNVIRGSVPELDEQRIDLVIVVSQLLTGYDSKYINTVYYDKEQEMDGLIQSISRTNRILNDPNYDDKLFGNAIFFKSPCAMYRNIRDAFQTYAHADKFEIIEIESSEQLVNDQITTYERLQSVLSEISTVGEDGFIEFNIYENEIEKAFFVHKFKLFLKLFNKIRENDKAMRVKNTTVELGTKHPDKVAKIKTISALIPSLYNAFSCLDLNQILDREMKYSDKQDEQQIYIELEDISFVGRNDFITSEWISQFNSLVKKGLGNFQHPVWNEINTMVRNDFSRHDIPIVNEVLEEYKNNESTVVNQLPYDRIIAKKQEQEENKVVELAKNYNLDVEAVKKLYLRKEDPSALLGIETLFDLYTILPSTIAYLEKASNQKEHKGRWLRRQIINSFSKELKILRDHKKNSN